MVVYAFRQRESDAAVVELFDLRPAASSSLDHLHFDDLYISNSLIIYKTSN